MESFKNRIHGLLQAKKEIARADVRLAIIQTGWDGTIADPNETNTAQTFATSGHFPLFLADASRDPNEEASRIRQQLYP